MKDYGKDVRRHPDEAGCWFLRHGHGDHDIWKSPRSEKPFTVPVKIKSRHTANKIMKDAGLPKAY